MNERMRTAALATAILATTACIAGAQTNENDDATAARPPVVAGQCFARVLVPATYRTTSEDFILRAATERIETTAPRFEWVEESIVTRQASEELIPVPTTFKKVREEVVVQDARLIWRLSNRRGKTAGDLSVARAVAAGLPEEAKPGECYAEYLQPAEYEKVAQQAIAKEATKKFEVTAAEYETIEEEVVTHEAAEEVVEVPDVFETIREEVLTRPAHAVLRDQRPAAETIGNYVAASMQRVEIPAEYESLERRSIKTPASTKKVPIEPKSKLVEVRRLKTAPTQSSAAVEAEYQTYEKTVLKSVATVGWRLEGGEGPGEPTGRVLCRDELPAKTAQLTKQIVDTPATVQRREIAQESLTVRRRKLVAAATERRLAIPAEKQTITRFAMAAEERLEWQRVLCRDDATPDLVRALQEALGAADFEPGPADGKIGRATLAAVERFQVANGLATGAITQATIEALGLTMP